MSRKLERIGGRQRRKDIRGARVGVPTRFVQVDANVDNGLIVQKPAAHDPVAGHETREVRTHVPDGTAIIKIGEVGPTADSRSLGTNVRENLREGETHMPHLQESPDGRVDSGGPVVREDVVIRVREASVLDEILEVAVRSSAPRLLRSSAASNLPV